MRSWFARLVVLWHNLKVAKQFALASIVVIGFGMAGVGLWINTQIKLGVEKHIALTTTFYMQGFVEPLVQELSSEEALSEQSNAALKALLSSGPLKNQVVALKVWAPDGTVVFSTSPELIGKKFPIEGALKTALAGSPSPELDDLGSSENAQERKLGLALMEIYAPLYNRNTGKVIAVGEFYLRADQLKTDLRNKVLQSWLIVGLLTLAMVASLSGIVLGASRTIDRQRASLRDRVSELSDLLADNQRLSHRIERANRTAADLNDRFLSQIGADLHDGPAQLLSFVLMRLGAKPVGAGSRNSPKGDNTPRVREALRDALKEIRNISSGLVLPEIDSLSLLESLELAASAHERLTGSQVKRQLSSSLPDVPRAIKASAFRLVQEGLNNAYKHAGGRGQTLIASRQGGVLVIEVVDDGPGFQWAGSKCPGEHLGLIGLQNRILALGGDFEVRSEPGAGTRLTAHIPFRNGTVDNAKEDSSRNHRRPSVDA
jgi:signal transduction histidine kinase